MRYQSASVVLAFAVSACGSGATVGLDRLSVRKPELAERIQEFSRSAFDGHGTFSISLEQGDSTIMIGLYRRKWLRSEYYRGCGLLASDTVHVYSSKGLNLDSFFTGLETSKCTPGSAQDFDTYTVYYSWDGALLRAISSSDSSLTRNTSTQP